MLNKKVLVLAGAVCLLVSVSSCKKEKAVPLTPEEIQKQEEINRKVTAANGIAALLMENKIEGAFYRMNPAYRNENSFSSFEADWKKQTENLGNLKSFDVDTAEYDALTYFKVIKVNYNFEKAIVSARYLFNPTAFIPVEVVYGDGLKEISKEQTPLKDLCSDYFKLGCGITGATLQGSAVNVPEFMNIVKDQFSSCTSTNLMKPVYVLNQAKSIKNYEDGINTPALDFTNVEKTLSWCKENVVALRGHTLVWHTQTPDWFFKEAYKKEGKYVSRQVMIERLDSFISQYFSYVQENYGDTVYCWDVVNEAVDPDKGDSSSYFMCRMENDNNDNGWYKTIGQDYPEVAFAIARKYAAPGVKLIYNDYGTVDKRKREYIYSLCKSLKEKGLIDGIGMQAYWDVKRPALKDIEDTINRFAELGLEIQITEWSIPAAAETAEGFNEQAERYASIFKLIQRLDTQGGGNANITCVSFFGVQDRFVLNPNDTNNTRLYDTHFKPKPAYSAIQDALKLYY